MLEATEHSIKGVTNEQRARLFALLESNINLDLEEPVSIPEMMSQLNITEEESTEILEYYYGTAIVFTQADIDGNLAEVAFDIVYSGKDHDVRTTQACRTRFHRALCLSYHAASKCEYDRDDAKLRIRRLLLLSAYLSGSWAGCEYLRSTSPDKSQRGVFEEQKCVCCIEEHKGGTRAVGEEHERA
jgi:hypothetical protein